MGKTQEIPVRENEKREGNSPRENAQQSGGHELQVPEHLATREEEEKCLRETKITQDLCMRSQQTQNRGESELTREECVREKNGQTWVE